MIQRKIILGLILCAFLSGCSLFGSNEVSKEEKLEINRHKWQKQDVSNHQFKLFVGCFCSFVANPTKIIVRDDTVNVVIDEKTGEKITFPNSDKAASKKYTDYPTIEELFETIEHAINRDAYRLKVKYSAHYGYPKKISINYGKNIADDFVNYQVTNFKLISPDI